MHDTWNGRIHQIHFPIVFVSVAGAVLLNPIKRFYFRSRKFFLQTLVSESELLTRAAPTMLIIGF